MVLVLVEVEVEVVHLSGVEMALELYHSQHY
jgi:hypothetical protein